MPERGIVVTPESARLWCISFGALYARTLKLKHRGYGDTFYIGEAFVKINGKQHYLWRAVDQDGEVWIFISRLAVMGLRLSASSGAYSGLMAANRGRL